MLRKLIIYFLFINGILSKLKRNCTIRVSCFTQ